MPKDPYRQELLRTAGEMQPGATRPLNSLVPNRNQRRRATRYLEAAGYTVNLARPATVTAPSAVPTPTR